MRAQLTVSTRFSPDSFEFVRSPKEWSEFDNYTTVHQTIEQLSRNAGVSSHAFQPSTFIAAMQLWFANALLRAGIEDDAASIRVGIKELPIFEVDPSGYMAPPAGVTAQVNSLLLPLGTSLVLPLILSVLVAEKAGKQRSLMVMMGLKMVQRADSLKRSVSLPLSLCCSPVTAAACSALLYAH